EAPQCIGGGTPPIGPGCAHTRCEARGSEPLPSSTRPPRGRSSSSRAAKVARPESPVRRSSRKAHTLACVESRYASLDAPSSANQCLFDQLLPLRTFSVYTLGTGGGIG